MPSALSLFSGCGGCSLGLQQAGFTVALAVDNNRDACATYAQNLARTSVWQADLGSIHADDLLTKTISVADQIDLIVGGPPCQGFSSAGARDWNDPRNRLLSRFVDLVVALRPTWFIMENVEGLLTANGGFYLTETVLHFLRAGYWVRAEKVYMEQWGLPQRRKRVLLVGNREGCEFSFPIPSHLPASQPSLFAEAAQLSLTDVISDLPNPTAEGKIEYQQPPANSYQKALRRADEMPVSLHQSKTLTDLLRERIHRLAPGETMRDLPDHLQHPSFQRRAFRRVMDGTPTEKRGGAPSGLKRLYTNEPALTITSAAPSEFVHPTEDRFLTLRECARLQSFPDWFEFQGSVSAVATQIGNAIPPLIMHLLAAHIATQATWRPVARSEGHWLGIEATRGSGMSPALVQTLTALETQTYAYTR